MKALWEIFKGLVRPKATLKDTREPCPHLVALGAALQELDAEMLATDIEIGAMQEFIESVQNARGQYHD